MATVNIQPRLCPAPHSALCPCALGARSLRHAHTTPPHCTSASVEFRIRIIFFLSVYPRRTQRPRADADVDPGKVEQGHFHLGDVRGLSVG